MEVIEDEQASEQVKKLRVALSSVSSQIEVSSSVQPIKLVGHTC